MRRKPWMMPVLWKWYRFRCLGYSGVSVGVAVAVGVGVAVGTGSNVTARV